MGRFVTQILSMCILQNIFFKSRIMVFLPLVFIGKFCYERRSQGARQKGAVAPPPHCLENHTCKKFKSGEILRGRGCEATSGTSFIIINIVIYLHVYHVTAKKIRFQLGKLVQKRVSEGEKLRF